MIEPFYLTHRSGLNRYYDSRSGIPQSSRTRASSLDGLVSMGYKKVVC